MDYPVWRCGKYLLKLERPVVMAIINVTPDSFSGDGHAGSLDAALWHAEAAIKAGAGILDVGGESSRPGASPVSLEVELARVIPVVEALSGFGVPVSVDTVKAEVMQCAVEAGASIINDINALRSPGALEAVAATDAGVCLMHMQGAPENMQLRPKYADPVAEVDEFLMDRLALLGAEGIDEQRIVFDPGFGFGKTLEHNILLFRALPEFARRGRPLLVGVSRKTMLGQLTGKGVDERVAAGIAASVLAVQRGASILRVHDVAATCDALAVWAGVELGVTSG